MRILLTGAGGFLGSHLAEALLGRGHEVVGVDNFLTGLRGNLEPLFGKPGFHFLQQDVLDPLEVPGDLDWILHFASPASPPKYLQFPLETMRVNAEGTWRLLKMARERGARFLLASTSEIYGDPQVHPQPESYWGNVNPIGPRSVYDESKRFAEALTYAFRREFGLGVRVARIFNTYGPRMDPRDGRVVSNFAVAALRGEPLTVYGDGSQTRSFQYVSDLVEGVLRLMESDCEEPVNLGNPEEFTVLDFARLVISLAGGRSSIEFQALPQDDPCRRKPDMARAERRLGHEPKVPVETGVARTLEYFRKTLGRGET